MTPDERSHTIQNKSSGDRLIIVSNREPYVHKRSDLRVSVENDQTMVAAVLDCHQHPDAWRRLFQRYIAENSEAEFSHGLCNECAERLYPEYCKKMK
jgi:hypothetical protein